MDSKTAKKIKSKNTKIEVVLGKAMWSYGYRYRKHCRNVYGKPDFCFKKKKIAIFCDSEFWHGKNFLEGEQFKTNADFWETKIKRNIQRDIEVNNFLKKNGWKVIRFWGKDIIKNLDDCLKLIHTEMEK
ncbi:very short patch repair endonuclease [Sulfurimonas marina]|uniref:Very short patch repair endonuclease n=1 Tax=Sulfurimonas marina TaxID=2590551 RepID=A0A7M1AWT9_9BACT|nr:very short patch repair endonuclease [Sulfurimonas marina]QOP41048.1 very short patch repair endonuclease [Sulfurimonas marina]